MTELVKITYKNEKPTVLGRNLHNALKIKTGYRDWFHRMVEHGFVEGRDFNTLKLERVQRDVDGNISCEITDHQLTLEMAKGICLLQKSEIGRRCREYIIDVEQRFNEPLKTPEELLLESAELMLGHGKRLSSIEERLEVLEARAEMHQRCYYTIAEYAALRGIDYDVDDVFSVERKAENLSREYGCEVLTVPESPLTLVRISTYHVDILKRVFKQKN